MIRGVHTMFYSSDPEATRAFLRDVLGFPHVDVGHGWLIFDLPEADMGVHPARDGDGHGEAAGTPDISFYTDDIEGTVAQLLEKGVAFDAEIEDAGFGLTTTMRIPGDIRVQLFQPHYEKN